MYRPSMVARPITTSSGLGKFRSPGSLGTTGGPLWPGALQKRGAPGEYVRDQGLQS